MEPGRIDGRNRFLTALDASPELAHGMAERSLAICGICREL